MELLSNCAAAGADARYREVERTPRYSGVSVSRGCSGAEGGSRLLSGSDFVVVDLVVFWEARASGIVKARGGRRGAGRTSLSYSRGLAIFRSLLLLPALARQVEDS